MYNVIEGNLSAEGFKFGIAVSRFNEFINSKLLDGAIDYLTRSGANESDITVVKVPGAFELPMAIKIMAETKKVRRNYMLRYFDKGRNKSFRPIVAAGCQNDFGAGCQL